MSFRSGRTRDVRIKNEKSYSRTTFSRCRRIRWPSAKARANGFNLERPAVFLAVFNNADEPFAAGFNHFNEVLISTWNSTVRAVHVANSREWAGALRTLKHRQPITPASDARDS